MKRILPLILLLSVSCASKKTSDRYREGNNDGQVAALTVDEEKKLTSEALKEMSKEYPPVKNQKIQQYIKKLGQKIVQANKLGGNPYDYQFTAVDVPQVNAFAMPAGSVFITIPIIAMADSEAEIAGVLGHEIGHVTARHTAERMYVAKKEQGKMWVLGGAGAALGGALGYVLGSKICAPNDLACKAKFTVYGAGGGGAAGLMVHKYHFMKNSQEDELESDRVGFRYAINAGYDKNKVGDFYSKLMKLEQDSKKGSNAVMNWFADSMSSHPPSKDRVAQAEELKQKFSSTNGMSSSADFSEIKKEAMEIMRSYQSAKK